MEACISRKDLRVRFLRDLGRSTILFVGHDCLRSPYAQSSVTG
jgi:hypothetical protein